MDNTSELKYEENYGFQAQTAYPYYVDACKRMARLLAFSTSHLNSFKALSSELMNKSPIRTSMTPVDKARVLTSIRMNETKFRGDHQKSIGQPMDARKLVEISKTLSSLSQLVNGVLILPDLGVLMANPKKRTASNKLGKNLGRRQSLRTRQRGASLVKQNATANPQVQLPSRRSRNLLVPCVGQAHFKARIVQSFKTLMITISGWDRACGLFHPLYRPILHLFPTALPATRNFQDLPQSSCSCQIQYCQLINTMHVRAPFTLLTANTPLFQ